MVKPENSLCVWLKMGILWTDLILLSFADQQRARSQESTDLLSLSSTSPLPLLSSPFSMTSEGQETWFLVCGVRCPRSSLFWFTAGFYICFMPFKATWVPHMGSSHILSMRLPWLRYSWKERNRFLHGFSLPLLFLHCRCCSSWKAWRNDQSNVF